MCTMTAWISQFVADILMAKILNLQSVVKNVILINEPYVCFFASWL